MKCLTLITPLTTSEKRPIHYLSLIYPKKYAYKFYPFPKLSCIPPIAEGNLPDEARNARVSFGSKEPTTSDDNANACITAEIRFIEVDFRWGKNLYLNQ